MLAGYLSLECPVSQGNLGEYPNCANLIRTPNEKAKGGLRTLTLCVSPRRNPIVFRDR